MDETTCVLPATNQPRKLEILVSNEDKYGEDIASMSDFFGLYIEQLTTELSTHTLTDVLEDIPVADMQILGELIHGADFVLKGEYGYIPDFEKLPSDIKSKLDKGIYQLGESRQVEGNSRAVIVDENGVRIKDITLKRILNTPDVMEMSRSITSQFQMRQISAKLDMISAKQDYLVEMGRNNNIVKPFLNARNFILRAQNAKTLGEQQQFMMEASKQMSDAINASRLDLKTSTEQLVKLTRFPIFRRPEQIRVYLGYIAQDLQLSTKFVGLQMRVLDYLGEHNTSRGLMEQYQMMLSDFADKPVNRRNQSVALLMQSNSNYTEKTQDYWLKFRSSIQDTAKRGGLLKEREMYVVSMEEVKDE